MNSKVFLCISYNLIVRSMKFFFWKRSLSPPAWNDTKKLINLYEIASAMSFLHENDYIHRDLKPDNIFEDEYLYPRIGDFGLGKHISKEKCSTQSLFGFKR
mgnify:CR=1 FL=1